MYKLISHTLECELAEKIEWSSKVLRFNGNGFKADKRAESVSKIYFDCIICAEFNYCSCCHRLQLNFVSDIHFHQSNFWYLNLFEKPAYNLTFDSLRILSNARIIPFSNAILCVVAWKRFSFVNWFPSWKRRIRLMVTKSRLNQVCLMSGHVLTSLYSQTKSIGFS